MSVGLTLIPAIAWRNLWRNPRRTWLTAGGIGFACLLLLFARSMQLGSYEAQINATTQLLTGHIQVQDERYLDEAKLEYRIDDVDAMSAQIASLPDVEVVAPRVVAFALASKDERSFGTQILGVDPEVEASAFSLNKSIVRGRYLLGGDEAVVGALLARNLGADLGDEIVVLGSGPEGGVAAIAVTIVGIIESSLPELDRGLMQIPLPVVQEAFYIEGQASYIAVMVADLSRLEQLGASIAKLLGPGLVVRNWEELLPDVVQGIALDRISARLMYGIVTLIVLFSIVNTFIMTLFERTREFGMLMAIGMRPWQLIAMLQLEALWLATLGGTLGFAMGIPVLAWLIESGIPIEGLEDITVGLVLPSHIKGAFVLQEFLLIPLVFVLGCQLASLAPGQRLFRLKPVEALRAE